MAMAYEIRTYKILGPQKDLAKKKMVRGLPMIEHVDGICDGCLTGKQRQNPFQMMSQYHAKQPLELWHGDLCGPITLPT
jgi:hypothetical protein